MKGKRQSNWIETKQSLRDARFRLSLKETESTQIRNDHLPEMFTFSDIPNGVAKSETMSTTLHSYGSLPKGDISMEPMSP